MTTTPETKTPSVLYHRGKHELSMLRLPSHDDHVMDTDGATWKIRMEGGFKLYNGSTCHPDFFNGAKDAEAFCWWFNNG